MEKKCDMCDFNYGKFVGARWAGLNISEWTYFLGIWEKHRLLGMLNVT